MSVQGPGNLANPPAGRWQQPAPQEYQQNGSAQPGQLLAASFVKHTGMLILWTTQTNRHYATFDQSAQAYMSAQVQNLAAGRWSPARVGCRGATTSRALGDDPAVISTILVEHPWMSPLALAVLVVAGPPAGRWLSNRPRPAWVLAGLALVPVALLTLVPVDRVPYERCAVHWAWPTPGRVELMANVVLFVAPVLLAAAAIRRVAATVLAGSALSAAIEVLQAIVPAIGRSCDTTDWLCNSIGAVIGGVLAWVALRLGRR